MRLPCRVRTDVKYVHCKELAYHVFNRHVFRIRSEAKSVTSYFGVFESQRELLVLSK